MVLTFIDKVTGTSDPNVGVGILSGLFALASLIPAILVYIKRWHDRDKSGWWMLIMLVPIIGSIWLLIDPRLLGRHAWGQSVRPATNERMIPRRCRRKLAYNEP